MLTWVACLNATPLSISDMRRYVERREIGANNLHIAIEYAGRCHSESHTRPWGTGIKPFPIVPGHDGAMIGGIAETQEMLDFCAEHGIE